MFGKEYKLIVKVDYKYFVKLNNDSIEIHTSTNTKKQVESILYDFYLHQLIEYINSIYSEAIRDFIDVKKLYYFNDSPLIKYSKVKTYFGKCYPKRNLIVLNVLLAKYDKIYIKSVLYHELCHYSYLDHQAGFYKLYESKFKNARKIQHELKQIKYNDLL